MRRYVSFIAAAMLAAAAPAMAQGDDYPSRPVTIIVPSAPGGAADGTARVLAEELGRRFGKTFIVENRPGSGGIIGTKVVTQAANDGYTLLFGLDASMTTVPYLLPKMPYQPQKELAPVSLVGKLQYVFVTNANTQIGSAQQLIAQAKAKPGRLTYASGGDGSVHHLAMELFQRDAGIKIEHVPYKAAPQGFGDVVAGHVDMMFIATGTAAPMIKKGKLHALGSSGNAPAPDLPDVAPLKNTVPGYVFESWFAIFAPAGTPEDKLGKLEGALRDALKTPAVQERMQSFGVSAEFGGPAVVKTLLQNDTTRYAPLITEIKSRTQ